LRWWLGLIRCLGEALELLLLLEDPFGSIGDSSVASIGVGVRSIHFQSSRRFDTSRGAARDMRHVIVTARVDRL
jgi:hypothetical protein